MSYDSDVGKYFTVSSDLLRVFNLLSLMLIILCSINILL